MKSVNDCVIEIAKYVNVMIDNADACKGDQLNFIWRDTSPYQVLFGYEDIGYIDKAASKCIDTLEKHVTPK